MKTAIFRGVSDFLRQRLFSQHVGRHCGVWVVDCASGQAYNISVIMALRALGMGMGPNCPKPSPIAPYQGTMAGASMVRRTRPKENVQSEPRTRKLPYASRDPRLAGPHRRLAAGAT